jgi:hypothetical protein
MEESKNHLLSERIIRVLKMDGPYFLPFSGSGENLNNFHITTNYFVKLFVRSEKHRICHSGLRSLKSLSHTMARFFAYTQNGKKGSFSRDIYPKDCEFFRLILEASN